MRKGTKTKERIGKGREGKEGAREGRTVGAREGKERNEVSKEERKGERRKGRKEGREGRGHWKATRSHPEAGIPNANLIRRGKG